MRKSWLNGRVILLTGASSGIGRELTKKLIFREDCHVIGIGRNEEKMKSLIADLGEKSDHFEYILADVSIKDNWSMIAEKIKDKYVSVLINNAGILPPFESFDHYECTHKNESADIEIFSKSINDTINTNLMSVIWSCVYLLPIIEQEKNPALINISSSASLCALPGISIYSASKAGVKNFTESVMCEKKYYVGLVCPGFTKTEIFRYQKHASNSKLINMVSTDLEKMTRKIYKGIRKKKKRMVLGFDAKCMDRLYRFMPKTSLKLFTSVLRSAHIELFDDVFGEKKIK